MMLDAGDKAALAAIARAALGAALSGERYVPANPGREALEEQRGAFVTLKTAGRLRGCLGCFTSPEPLWRTVAEYAAYSALDDPRFAGHRLQTADLDAVTMEISALTPLVPCPDPMSIVLGEHGIYVKQGGRTGCLLPQVATEQGWSVEEFWDYCCRDKALLDRDAWRRPGMDIRTFTAEVFPC